MAKQIDLYKTINRHSKQLRSIEKEFMALTELSLLMYSTEMRKFITRKLANQWNRYLLWLKIKRFFGSKSAKLITGPIIVKSYNNE